jgi:hypothetical protein
MLINGIKVTPTNIDKISLEQVNHALGQNGKSKYPKTKPPELELRNELKQLLATLPKKGAGRQWSITSTEISARNKKSRIKKLLLSGKLTKEQALELLAKDKMLRKYLTKEEINNNFEKPNFIKLIADE